MKESMKEKLVFSMKWGKNAIGVLSLLGALALAACSDNDDNGGETTETRTAIQVTNATISGRDADTGSGTTGTRATDNAWQAADAIGITLLDADTGTPVDGKNACRYVTADATGTFAPADEANTAYYPTHDQAATVLAFYPYTAIDASLIVPISTADQTSLSDIDFMAADISSGHSAAKPEVSLQFRHKLVKLVVSINGTEAGIDLTGATLTLGGTCTAAGWNLPEAKLVNLAEVKDIALPAVHDAAAGTLSSTAICLPAEAGAGVALRLTTADGRTYDAPLDAGTALAPGTVNTLHVTLDRTAARISATVTDWTTGVTANLSTVDVCIEADDSTVEGVNTLTLWRADAAGTKADYTFGGGAWSSPTPFYLQSLPAGTTFYARHTPATTPATGLPDVLGNTAPAALTDGRISLALQHLYAKLAVVIKYNGTATTRSSLTLRDFITEGTLGDDNTLTPGTATGSYTVATGSEIIVLPQTLHAGTRVSTTIGGTNYSARLTSALTLEAGKRHVITLSADEVTVNTGINVTVTDWADGGTANTTVTIENLAVGGSSTGTNTGITLAADDRLDIYYIKDGELGENGTYTYGNGSWNANKTFYWDAIPKVEANKYSFLAQYTPIAKDAFTEEKDYLIGTSTDNAFGTSLSFTMKHIMSRLTIIIRPGTGYADYAALESALSTATLSLNRLDGIALNAKGECTYTLADAPADIDVKSAIAAAGASFIVAPQTLTDDHQIVLKLKNGNTYTLAMKEITLTSGGMLSELTAGTSYTLTLTVNETAVTIGSLTLTDWTTTTGSGTLTPDSAK